MLKCLRNRSKPLSVWRAAAPIALTRTLVGAVAVLAGLAIGSGADARALDDVLDSGYITVFVYEDYAPYSWQDDDGNHGVDIELAAAFADSLGVELRLLIRGADENLDDDLRVNLWKGDLVYRQVADLMLHVPYDREVDTRNELVAFFSPYFVEQMAVVHDLSVLPKLESFARFVYHPIGVEVDTAGDFFLSNAFGGKLQQQIRRGRTFAETAAAFRLGEVAAVMGSRAQAEWLGSTTPDTESGVAQPPMPGIVRSHWPVGVAVKHDSRDLGYAFDEFIGEAIEQDFLTTLYAKYGVEWIAPER